MTSWAIVAIPEVDTPVWQISSEKVPHLTLLFLGEQDNDKLAALPRMIAYLNHLAESDLKRFGMYVDHRGTLGSESADVLYFAQNGAAYKHLVDIRSYMLQEPSIADAHASADQYPKWIPHLTLGYPETPAHPDNRDYPGITYVRFTKLALWTDDYSGFEIPLKDDVGEEVLAMSDEAVDRFLAHHGIKGMKWGKRKRRTSSQVQKDDRKKAVANRRTLSDKDIDARIARLEKERKLKTLTEESQSAGRSRVKQIMANSGSKAAGVILTGAMLYAVKASMEGSFNTKAAAGYMTPKPKK